MLAVQVAFLWPLLRTPYLFDDEINSSFRGGGGYERVTFLHHVWTIAHGWIDQGRWFPVSFFQGYAQFQYLPGLFSYKVLLLALVVVSTVSVVALLRRLGLSPTSAALVALGATLTIQFRLYNDPVLAYTGLQQSVLTELALSVLLFHVWLRDARRSALIGSVVLIALAASTYESAPLLCAMHLIVAIVERRRVRAGFRAAAVPLGTAAAFLALSMVLRSQAVAVAPGYQANLAPATVLRTFGDQLLGTVPLSYVGLNPGGRFVSREDLILRSIGLPSIVIGLAVMLVSWWLFHRGSREPIADRAERWQAVTLGTVLIVAPAAPIALARRYQAELAPGIAYLPVFLQGFGLALVITSLAVPWLVGSRQRRVLAAGAALMLGLGAAFAHRANVVVVDMTQPAKHVREAARTALDRGALDRMPEGTRMVASPGSPLWVQPAWIYQHAKIRVASIGPGTVGRNSGDWWLGTGPDYVATGPLSGQSGPSTVTLTQGGSRRIVLSAGVSPWAGQAAPGSTTTLPSGALPDLVDVAPLDQRRPALYGFAGCGGTEGGSGPAGFHWCDRRGALAVVNPTREDQHLTGAFSVQTAGPQGARVSIVLGKQRRTLNVGAVPVPVRIPIDIPARGTLTIMFATDGQRVVAPGDPRSLFLRLSSLSLDATR